MMAAPAADLLGQLDLRYMRTIRVNASAHETSPDESEDKWPDDDGLAAKATIFAGRGDMGLGWRLQMRRGEMTMSAWVIAMYDVPGNVDFNDEQLLDALREFAHHRALQDLRPYVMGLASSMEGVLSRPSSELMNSQTIEVEGVINLDKDVADR